MIVVDSSVWIDFFSDRFTVQTSFLAKALPRARVLIADLVLAEVLQGARSDGAAQVLLDHLAPLQHLAILDRSVAIEAARYYRLLRARGVTIRKTIDTLIATRCILDGIPLLYSDRDFDPFVEHLGLISALPRATGALQ